MGRFIDMQAKKQTLVSCICLTHNSLDLLRRSVRCFQDQTYQNRELILAFTDDNKVAREFSEELSDPSIRSLTFPPKAKMSLGEKRNAAIAHANGHYVCIWDDDDWHHRMRIENHFDALAGTIHKASILSRLILFDGVSKTSYLSATRWGWEQTLFCEKSVFEDPDWQYKDVDRGEDSALVYKLKQCNMIQSISSPYMYIYVYHSKNVFHRGHWEVNLLPWAQKLPEHIDTVVNAVLNNDVRNPEALAALELL
jgi:glycosyltransferase involved in cell wall biosynthesis